MADVRVPSSAGVPLDDPIPDAFTRPWWDATRAHRLLVRRCAECGRAFHPPRPLCPHCWSALVAWDEATGRGTIYSFSVVHENDLGVFRGATPYVIAVVELDEGARVMTSIVDSEPAALRVGARVEVRFVDRDEFTFPCFRVVAES